jgi:hypothetical protein
MGAVEVAKANLVIFFETGKGVRKKSQACSVAETMKTQASFFSTHVTGASRRFLSNPVCVG